jgi:hypothetical protein
MIKMRHFILSAMMVMAGITTQAQDVVKELRADVNRSAGTNYSLPAIKVENDTPAPDGKKPFYINHYACPSSYYLQKEEYYDEPLEVFMKADSLGKLTKLGKDVLRRLEIIHNDAHNRTTELTKHGAEQSHGMMKLLAERFPEAFTDKGYYSIRSVVQNTAILTMIESAAQLSKMYQPLNIRTRVSHEEQPFMNPQDKDLTDDRMDSITMERYDRFAALNTSEIRLMESLFNDQNYVAKYISPYTLSQQLFKLAGSIQNTDLTKKTTLYDIFTTEEIHRHWRKNNAWNYINYGACKLNGARQPYLQRAVLRNMMHMGDSVLKRYAPMAHVRYTNERVLMSLACLMELNDYGIETDNLDSLETLGWADYKIAPLGGSIVMVHYRKDRNDQDVLVKVLLNNREARLPLKTDCAPYYHWNDVKRYYLRKLYRYENERFNEKAKK